MATLEQEDAATAKVAVHVAGWSLHDQDDVPNYEDKTIDGKRCAWAFGAWPEYDPNNRHWLLFKEPVDADTALIALKALIG